MNLKLILRKSCYLFTAIAIITITGCQPDEISSRNSLTGTPVDATFTVTPIDGSAYRFRLEGKTDDNIQYHRWDIGDGSSEYKGESSEEIFLPDAGVYEVKHFVYSHNGGLSSTSVQTITVTTPDPISGNLLKGSKFKTPADYAQWTVLHISSDNASITHTPAPASGNLGHVTITATSYQQKGLYQAVEVVAGRKYKIDMRVFGGAAMNTWFEVYASKTAPIPNTDYSADGRRIGLSTWDGCGTAAFDNKLSAIKCVGSGNIVQFAESGTVYLLIKCGGENVGVPGISFTNVEFRGQPN